MDPDPTVHFDSSRIRIHSKNSPIRFTIFQSWARDNTAATTWPCFQATQVVGWCILVTIFVVTTPFNIFQKNSCPCSSLTVSCCHIVVVVKKKNCRMPSFAIYYLVSMSVYRRGRWCRRRGRGSCGRLSPGTRTRGSGII